MNKKTIRIAGWAMGLSMAVAGIGAAASLSDNETIETKAAEYSETFGYSDKGDTWTLSNCTDQSSYWQCPTGSTTSVAFFDDIFKGLIITSDVTITINNATYGSGNSPTASTFVIYREEACSNSIAATQSGTLASSSSYVNTIYTVAKANAAAFDDDLAIKITKPGRTIRLKSVTVAFSYTVDSKALSSISVTTAPTKVKYLVGESFDRTGMVVTANFDDLSSNDITSSAVITPPDMSSVGNKNVNISYTYNEVEKTTTQPIQVRSIKNITGASTAPATLKVGQTLKVSDVALTADCDDDSVYWGTLVPTSVSCDTSSIGSVKASATYSGATGIKTYQWDVEVEEADAGSEYNPFTVAEAINHINDVIDGGTATGNDGKYYYVTGIISSFYNNSVSSGKISYYISDDGSTSTELEAYKGKGLGNSNFSAITDLTIGDRVTIYGQIKKYNSTFELDDGNYLISQSHVSSLSISNVPIKTEYEAGEAFDPAGLVLNVSYGSGPSNTITYSSAYADAISFDPSGSLDKTDDSVEISYGGQTVNQSITVSAVPVVNSISIDPDSLLMNRSDTSSLTAVIDKDDGAALNLKWLTSNSSIAAISGSGTTVTISSGASDGNATITAFDDKNDNGSVDLGEQSGTCEITVREVQLNFFYKITSTEGLTAGDKIAIVAHNTNDYVMTTSSLSSGKAAAVSQATWDSETCFRADLLAHGFTLGGDAEGWTLKNATNNYLKYGSSANFVLDKPETLADAYKWTISATGNGGTFAIANVASTNRHIAYRDTSSVFGAYASSNIDASEYFDVEIYKLVDPTVLTLEGCNNAGSFGGNWSTLQTAFNGLTNAEKAYYKHATYNVTREGEVTTVTATNGTKEGVATYLAKYDYIIGKYNTESVTTYADFIGRVSAGMITLNEAESVLQINEANVNYTALIISVLAGTTILGGSTLLLRRRREN